MTMPQSSTVGVLTHEELSRFETRLDEGREAYETRLQETPEIDDLSVAVHRRSVKAHREIVAALARIQEGSFGFCEACHRPISHERLDAMPHARHCMACAARRDRNGSWR